VCSSTTGAPIRCGGCDLFGVGGDEERHAHPGIGQGADETGEAVLVARDLQTALGRALLPPFGDDAGGVGPMGQRDALHLFGGGHLEVQRDGDRLHDRGDIGVADMAAILPQMRGDPVGAGGLGHPGRAHRIGQRPSRAFLSVATWSIFTPSLSLSVISVSVLPSLPRGVSPPRRLSAQLVHLLAQPRRAAFLVGADDRNAEVVADQSADHTGDQPAHEPGEEDIPVEDLQLVPLARSGVKMATKLCQRSPAAPPNFAKMIRRPRPGVRFPAGNGRSEAR
jgi:hypothetical protein